MAQEDKRGEAHGEGLADASIQQKKRARRRLIGAAALALLAAIVLPMVMDHQPAAPLKDIQVRIPSPDEGVTQRVVTKPVTPESSKPVAKIEPEAPRAESVPVVKPEPKPEVKAEVKPEPAKEEKAKTAELKRAEDALAGKPAPEVWEVQLGAYQNSASVTNLVRKLKDLGIPTYTENVDTPSGSRTRVRAGPFPSQEAAEKARTRVKIVGVDGPVARKP